MKRLSILILIPLLFLGTICHASDLLTYVEKPDASFKWEKVSKTDSLFGTTYTMKMTSQTWQGIEWNHDIEIFKPVKVDYPASAVLMVTFGRPGGSQSKVMELLSAGTGTIVATLYGVPNQPLFDGKREDDLIAHTFVKMLETKDSTWALLLPMTKSAVRAMDAIQAFSKAEFDSEITGFIVSGASKRGWTTWLTAAADPVRVKAIVPMVYDNLNLHAQMRHQIACYGKYSEKIDDYTTLHLQEMLQTEDGKRLASLVDPWTYRDRITMPKLIINGSNDDYWVADSLNLYWEDLKGTKAVFYVPNAGHGLGDPLRLSATVGAYVCAVMAGSPLPDMTWRYGPDAGEESLEVTVDASDATARLWTARSDSRDFRKSKWESKDMTTTDTGFTGRISLPSEGYLAVFGEVTLNIGGRRASLSTQMRILDSKGPV